MKDRVVVHILQGGMSQREAARAEGVSLDSANKIWQGFCGEVLGKGLVPSLESRNMPGAVDLALLSRDMRTLHVTPQDCNRALPLAVLCRDLTLPPDTIRTLIEAAVRLGTSEFPAAEWAAAVGRIHRREKEAGLTIDQVDAALRAATAQIQGLRAENAILETTISNQRNQSNKLTREIQTKGQRVTDLDARLVNEKITLTQLDTYITDRRALTELGFDVQDVGMARLVLTNLSLMNYSPTRIIISFIQVGNLQTTLTSLTNAVTEKKNELRLLEEKKRVESRDITTLEEQRKTVEEKLTESDLKAAQRIQATTREVTEARLEASKNIMDVNAQVQNSITNANTTKQQLDDFTATREKLRKWDVNI